MEKSAQDTWDSWDRTLNRFSFEIALSGSQYCMIYSALSFVDRYVEAVLRIRNDPDVMDDMKALLAMPMRMGGMGRDEQLAAVQNCARLVRQHVMQQQVKSLCRDEQQTLMWTTAAPEYITGQYAELPSRLLDFVFSAHAVLRNPEEQQGRQTGIPFEFAGGDVCCIAPPSPPLRGEHTSTPA